MDQERVDRIGRDLAEFGLKGEWWLLGGDEALLQGLAASVPEQTIGRVPLPEEADLTNCSILLVGLAPRKGGVADAIEGLLSRSHSRPLIVVLPEAQDEALTRRLALSGYLEPIEADCGGIVLKILQHTRQDHKRHFDVAAYWEQRYRGGRNSGAGSYGRLARFKARFLNRFVEEFGIQSVIELGCGDGAQLALADYPRYYGLDVSPTVVAECESKFADDSSKSFSVYQPKAFDPEGSKADLALSLDVVYHLSNDDTYRSYLHHLFGSAKRFVIIYSNSDVAGLSGVDESAGYIRFRDFLQDVEAGYPEWQLVSAIPNRFPYSSLNPSETSFADFYVFRKSKSKEVSQQETRRILDRMVLHKALNTLTIVDENFKNLSSTLTGNDQLLRKLDKRVAELFTSYTDFDSNVSGKLHQMSESIDVANEESLTVLNEIRRQVARVEVTQNQQLGRRVDQLTQALESKQKELDEISSAYRKVRDEVVPELEKELSEVRILQKQRDELTARLATASDELDRARKQEIPGLKRLAEIEKFAAERTIKNLRSSVTWQIGACFREAAGSFQGLIRLPVSVLRVLRRLSRTSSERRQQGGPKCLFQKGFAPSEWVELDDSPVWLCIKLASTRELEVWGRITLEPKSDVIKRCGLVRIEYLDSESRVISGQHKGVNFSRQVGHYKYLRCNSGDKRELFRLRPPEGARLVRLGFQAWRCPGKLKVANEIDLSPATRPERKPVRKFEPPGTAEQELSILGWPEPPGTENPLVLSVMDEFTEGCFESDLRLLQPRPDNWYALAKKYPPVAVFVESAWKGNGGSWQYRVGNYSYKPGNELEEMLTWAREAGIPSIFWNKEDPVHHEKFMKAASLSDHVFTTDENMVNSYRKRIGHDSVHALPFAAQPALHKPAPLDGRVSKACFAGSWYGDRHVERGEAMKWLLGVALKHGLDIFDRNHGTGNFPFPEEYVPGIRGSLAYRDLCREYSRYRVFLNVNSVTDSPTMFSRRVFELLACGTPVVSTYAKGLEELFDSGSVWLVRNEDEADEAIQTLLTDDAEWRRRSLAGIREVFSGHTYAHRINEIFSKAGLTGRLSTDPRLLLLASAHTESELECLVSFARQQSYLNYELLIESDVPGDPGRMGERISLVDRGQLYQQAVARKAHVDAMGSVLCQYDYGAHYLQDLANAIIYQPTAKGWAKSAGKDAFCYGVEAWSAASIWRPAEFLAQWSGSFDRLISSPDLYCVDSSQFRAQTKA